jgi:hypothetical protein
MVADQHLGERFPHPAGSVYLSDWEGTHLRVTQQKWQLADSYL